MANAILNFHFDYLNTSLTRNNILQNIVKSFTFLVSNNCCTRGSTSGLARFGLESILTIFCFIAKPFTYQCSHFKTHTCPHILIKKGFSCALFSSCVIMITGRLNTMNTMNRIMWTIVIVMVIVIVIVTIIVTWKAASELPS